ncbi:small acidic protein-like [Patiria miniata]|uniref:Small acidic protein n=1 Tax=Patiria miniata TaxID=46514 RepID=A0A913Z622_PATMI|nr:small acidic protein-like [Patiria miniata]
MSMRSGEKEKEGGPSMDPVHSANQWESADFGDNAQKEKFLRLMGGMKKQHTGRFVIGETNKDAHSRTDGEMKKMEENLEHQYKVGLEKKLTGQSRRHIGLGFSEPEEKEEKKSDGTHTRFDDEDEVSKDSEIFDRELEDGTKDGGDGKRPGERDAESEKERRDKRQKREEKRREGERERRGSRERDPEQGASRREERDRSHRGSRDDDRKHRDRDDRQRKVERDDGARHDSKTSSSKSGDSSGNGDKKHRHSEERGDETEQKRKKHKKREDDSGSE